MKQTNISSSYSTISSGSKARPHLGQQNALSNRGTANVNANTNILNPNIMAQNSNFISNSNCFPHTMAAINNTSNHTNNIRLISKKRNKRQTIVKRKFTDSEDIALASLVEIHGQNNWKLIARNMPSDRTPRQCRERWKYYLSEGLPNNDDWTHEEEKLLLEKYEIYGPHWAKIAKFFDHKNDINLKNRFNKIKRNKLSGMLFDPSMSEDFDNATREKPPNNIPQAQPNSNPPPTLSDAKSYTQNANPEYSNEFDSDVETIDAPVNHINHIDNSNVEKNTTNSSVSLQTNINQSNYLPSTYYTNSVNEMNNSQASFSANSDSSLIQSSASSGKSSSNTSMLNSAQSEAKYSIVINRFNHGSKERVDLSESSGNNSNLSGSSAPLDDNFEANQVTTTIGTSDKRFMKKGQYSIQSLLLNNNSFDQKRNNSNNNFVPNNSNNPQLQTNSDKSREGYHKIIELPMPISLL